jgi:hypothetical protein
MTTQTKASAQTKTPFAADKVNDSVVVFDEKAIEDSKKLFEESRKLFEDSRQAIEEINEKAIEDARKARTALRDAYEKRVLTLADSYERAASNTDVEWIKNIVAAQAGATRELTKAYVNAARELDS